MMIKSAGKIVYDTDNLHNVTTAKNILEYSDDYSRSIAKNSFWYLDTTDTTDVLNTGFKARRNLTKAAADGALAVGSQNVNVIIPLNRYSFFEELEDKLLVPMQLQFNIEIGNDDELIYRVGAAAPGRVVIDRFLLWVPKLTPKDSLYDKFVSSFLKEKTWTYLREMYEVSALTNTSGFFQISSSIDKVKHISVYLQRVKSNNSEQDPYMFDTYNINENGNGASSLINC